MKFKLRNCDTFLMEDGREVVLEFGVVYVVVSGPEQLRGLRVSYAGWSSRQRGHPTYELSGTVLSFIRDGVDVTRDGCELTPDDVRRLT